MKTLFHTRTVCIVFVSFIASATTAAATMDYRLGDTWIYDVKQEGKPKKIQAVLKVALEEGEGEAKRWSINQKIGDQMGKLLVDASGLVHEIQFDSIPVIFNPPIPMLNPPDGMAVGDEKKFETVASSSKSKVKMDGVVIVSWKRLEDQSMTVPAGRYENCAHYRMEMELSLGKAPVSINLSSTSEEWRHSDVNGSVKTLATNKGSINLGGNTAMEEEENMIMELTIYSRRKPR